MSKQQTNPRGWATLAEASEYLGYSPNSLTSLRRRIADGTIPAYKLGKTHTLRIRWEDLDAALTPLPTAGASS
ncbi:MAG: helix-turn-helix domain-containing protein [Arachnia sp.]